MARVVLDPVTRIEGHLSIELEGGFNFDTSTSGAVTGVHASSTMYRGFENILKGRDPQDAIQITQRICGVCPVPHTTAATFAIENTLGFGQPTGGPNSGYSTAPTEYVRLIRNIIQSSEFLMSHITHFYTLALPDFVQGPNMSPWTPNWDDSYYDPLLRRSNPLGWDASGNPQNAYTAVITDYVLALQARRKAADLVAIFAGRFPMQSTYVAGGVTTFPATGKIEQARILLYKGEAGIGTTGAPALGTIMDFIMNHYIPMTEISSLLHGVFDNDKNKWSDIVTANPALSGMAAGRGPYFGNGANLGAGCRNFLSWGVFDLDETSTNNRLLKRGSIEGATNTASGTWGDIDPALVYEYITNAHYRATDDAKSPFQGVTWPDTTRGYSWHKAPRYPVTTPTAVPATAVKEVGSLARMWVSNYYSPTATGAPYIPASAYPASGTIAMRNHAFSALPQLGDLGLTYHPGISVMDRYRARALEALCCCCCCCCGCLDKVEKKAKDDIKDNIGKIIDDLKTVAEIKEWLEGKPEALVIDILNDIREKASKGEDITKIAKQLFEKFGVPIKTAIEMVKKAIAILKKLFGLIYDLFKWLWHLIFGTSGVGLTEAPRGAVGHWVRYKNGKIDNYQIIAPTTWNGSPRDLSGNPGPIEQALNGIPIRAVKSGTASIPVEALIVTHSFDPCIACSVHVVEPKKSAKKKLSKYEVEGV